MTEVSIVIPTRNKLSRLRLVLKALESQINDRIEVIIVFDGCEKAVVEEFKLLKFKFTSINVVLEHNVGRATARNYGIKVAKGRIVIFLDDDIVPCESLVQQHLEGHKKEKQVVIGRVTDVALSEQEIIDLCKEDKWDIADNKIRKNILQKKIQKTPQFKASSRWRWLMFYTGNISVERIYLNQVKGFDEYFKGWGHEDIDLGIRLVKANLFFKKEIDIEGFHIAHESNFLDKSVESQKNMKYMLKKYKNDPLVSLVLYIAYLKHKFLGYTLTISK